MDFEEEPQSKTHQERISISVVQNHGRFRRAIPCMSMPMAVFCCMCNMVVPGSGTLLSALTVFGDTDIRVETTSEAFLTNLLAAFLQFILTPLIIGYIWSLIWGILFVQIARKWFIASIDSRSSSLDCCPCSRW